MEERNQNHNPDGTFAVGNVSKGGRPKKTNIDVPLPGVNWDIDLANLGYRDAFDAVVTPTEFMGVLRSILQHAQEGRYRQQELIVRMAGMYEPQQNDKGAPTEELFALLGIKKTTKG